MPIALPNGFSSKIAFSCKTSDKALDSKQELWIDVLQTHLPAEQNVTFHEVNGRTSDNFKICSSYFTRL